MVVQNWVVRIDEGGVVRLVARFFPVLGGRSTISLKFSPQSRRRSYNEVVSGFHKRSTGAGQEGDGSEKTQEPNERTHGLDLGFSWRAREAILFLEKNGRSHPVHRPGGAEPQNEPLGTAQSARAGLEPAPTKSTGGSSVLTWVGTGRKVGARADEDIGPYEGQGHVHGQAVPGFYLF